MQKVLITAGPTREYLDPVRYLSNDSSGHMGFELAKAAIKRGMDVTLIAGPVALDTPKGAKRVDITSAEEMFREVKRRYKKADVVIMAAAVSDWRPARYSPHKLKKTHALKRLSSYALAPTPDILAWLGKNRRRGQIIVGFALETGALLKNASAKMRNKNCDMIVANLSSAIGGQKSSVTILTKRKKPKKIATANKSTVAEKIICEICLCTSHPWSSRL